MKDQVRVRFLVLGAITQPDREPYLGDPIDSARATEPACLGVGSRRSPARLRRPSDRIRSDLFRAARGG